LIPREYRKRSAPARRAPAGVPTAGVVRVTAPAGVEAELAADALWRAGAVAIEERAVPTGVVLVAGVAPGDDIERLLGAVGSRWPAEAVAIDLHGALDAWRSFARPVLVGDRLLVRPPWLPAGPHNAEVDLVIDPGRAFGSGAHASTRLALAALERLVRGGERVLDAGCGSGVLGIAALGLGAADAVGVDHEPAAVVASRVNAARNAVGDRFAVSGGPLDEVVAAHAPFDLVMANLLLPDVLAVAPALRAALAAAGSLVVSGILVDQRTPVIGAATPLGLVPVGEEIADGWLAVTFVAAAAGHARRCPQPAASSR
jgi:ribosomal protein L11 methylase PrmA